ncbi:MAG: HEAT repeat domain-containing protein [Myxococcota bacterium]
MKSGLLHAPAGLVVAVIAVTLSTLASIYSCRSIGEMREGQEQLARQIDELRTRTQRGVAATRRVDAGPEATAVDSDPKAPRVQARSVSGVGPERDDSSGLSWAEETAVMAGDITPAMRESRRGILEIYDQLDPRARREALGDLAIFARWGDPEALGAIVGALHDADPKVRQKSVNIIGKLRDDQLVEHLAPLLDDPEPRVRRELGKSIDKLSGPYAEPLLMALLEDSDPEIVTDAIERLGSGRHRGARLAVASLVESDDLEWIAAAGVALRRLGDERGANRATSLVAEQLNSSNPKDRVWAVRSIRSIRAGNAIAYLEKGLLDSDPKVRRESEKALERLKKTR